MSTADQPVPDASEVAELPDAAPPSAPPPASSLATPDTTAAAEPNPQASKLPQSSLPGGHKRKVALFMAYVGAGYLVRRRGSVCHHADDHSRSPGLIAAGFPVTGTDACVMSVTHSAFLFFSMVYTHVCCPALLATRMLGMLIAPVSTGQGFQRNPGVKTVEEDYHKAIHAAGGISDDNAMDFAKVGAAMSHS